MFFLARAFFWLFIVFGALSGPHDKSFATAIVKDLGVEAARIGQNAGQSSLNMAARHLQTECTNNPALCMDITGKIASLASPSPLNDKAASQAVKKQAKATPADTLRPADLVPSYKKPLQQKPASTVAASKRAPDIKTGG